MAGYPAGSVYRIAPAVGSFKRDARTASDQNGRWRNWSDPASGRN